MKLFEQFIKTKPLVEETKYLKIYNLSQNEKNYRIIITKKYANRHSIIHCTDDCIAWEQAPLLPRLEGRSFGIKKPIYKFVPKKDCYTIFVIKGKPNGITGLDDSVFRSNNKFDDNFINVMTYKKFKTI